MAAIAREGQVAEQNMQHFMSQSAWSGAALIEPVQEAVSERHELQGGVLILDESADEKSGDNSAGAGRQHNGRMGKVDEAQGGVSGLCQKPALDVMGRMPVFARKMV